MRAAALVILAVLTGAGCSPYTGGARPVSPHESLAGYVRAAPTPVVLQKKETDCGLAALAMVAAAWNRAVSVEELAKASPPTDKGVRLAKLRDLARARGLEAYAIAGTREDLARELGNGRPVVVGLVMPYVGNKFLGHYEVAIALDPRRGDLVTLDPATGRSMRRDIKTLEAEWAPSHHATLVVTGTTDARSN